MTEEKNWKPLELIKVTADYLASREVQNSRLDAEILLCEIMGLKRRVDLYAGFEREISGKELTAYRELIKRRAAREPVSRILGRREFMGLPFKVTPDVLSPRPETELLVEAVIEAVRPKKATLPEPETEQPVQEETAEPSPADDAAMAEELDWLLDSYAEDVEDEDAIDADPAVATRPASKSAPAAKDRAPASAPAAAKKAAAETDDARVKVLDLGTGSGCIAVSIAAHLPGARVLAVDASPKALAVAKQNAEQAQVRERIAFRQGDWFAACREGERFDIILSNPPYLVEGDAEIWPEVSQYDPAAALYGGKDGLDCYRRIIPDAADWLAPGGRVFFEVGAGQAARVAELLRGAGFREVGSIKDYGGIERVVRGLAPDPA